MTVDIETILKVAKALGPSEKVEPKTKNLGWHIVVLQRGHVAVGELFKTGQECELRNAAIIRTWGTTKGLGEIAEGGPTAKTILDAVPNGMKFHWLAVITAISCVESKWKK